MKGLLRKILVMVIVALFLGAIGSAFFKVNVNVKAAGATIYVDDDNTAGPWDGSLAHPYQNITSGLAHASDGDTVHVFSGTYVENVVVDKSVTLEGESKPVINGMTGHGIDITANDVTIEGFNITYSGYCIYTGASGFSIRNNVFWHNSSYDFYGIYWDISESSLTEDYMVYASVVEGNEFYMSGMYDAVYVYVGLDYGSNSGYNVEIGDIQICNNKFYMEGSTATGIYIDEIYVQYLYGGTVSFGVLNMSGNTMYGGDCGIDFYGYLDDLQDVQASVGDVIVNDNILVNQSFYGMYVDYYDGTYLYGNTVGTYGDLIIMGNTITSVYSADGIYLSDIGYWYEFYDNASLEVGNVYIEENGIDVGGEGIYVYGYEAGYDLYDNSSFTMGYVLVRDNIINSDSLGIHVDFEEFGNYMDGASSFTMGNLEITGNLISSTSAGIYLDIYDFGYEMYENSSFTMGSILANSNIINSTDYGIYVDYIGDFGETMYGNSSFTMDNVELIGNEIVSGNDGIHIEGLLYFGIDMDDKATFMMNSILVNENTVNSGWYGIGSWYIQYFGEEMHGNSSFTMGNIEFCRNTVNSTADAIGFSQFTDFGTNMYGNSSFSMGSVLVNDNTLHSIIWLTGFGRFGAYLYENSSCTMGNIEFCRNMVYSDWADVITFWSLQPFGYEMHHYSLFRMGDFSVNNNIIASDGSHSGISCSEGSGGFGINVYDNAVAMTGSFEFDGNDISFTWCGFSLGAVKDAIIRNNILWNNTYGIYLSESDGNNIYHNNFVNNTIQADVVTPNYNNTWDNGYPSGGNYWSDYLTRYPDATEIDHTGIGDTAYEIDTNNTDHYPLWISYETTPPTITILSPENTTYAVNASIPLTFTVDEFTSWMGYSLNGQANVTITENTTLPTLPDGWHYVTVYANDTFGNMGFATVYFTVDTTKPDIINVVQNPLTNILPDTVVKINATVTDATSGIKQVTLNYTTGDGTWISVEMTNLEADIWNATIPAFPYGTNVTYVIIAEDNAGNTITSAQLEYELGYQVVPEFPLWTILVAFMMATLLVATIFKRKTLRHRAT
jgi:parallel beta-helix repeat protein